MPRILLVEDSPTQAQQVAFFLEDAGIDVDIAHDGERALARLRERRDVDLVASDVVMPGMDGYSLCRALKADPATRDLPVVLLTSLREPGELLEALASGADSFVTKPVDPDEIVHRVRAVLENEALRRASGERHVPSDRDVSFHFRGRTFSAPADPARLVNYFAAAFEDFLSAREREQERAVSEAALRESMRLLQSTVDALPLGIALLDAAGNILSVNAEWRAAGDTNPFCGTAHRVGTSYLSALDRFAGPESAAATTLAQGLRAVIGGERAAYEFEFPSYATGRELWFAAHVTRYADAGELRIVTSHKDVTARHRAEEGLRESHRRLETTLSDLKAAQATVVAQERLRALGQMASGIAHDFNNALAPILGYSEQLLFQPRVRGDDAKLTHRLELISTSAKDAARVVSRLREFARPSSGEAALAPVRLDEMVRTVIELTRPRWKHESEARGIDVDVVTHFEDAAEVAGDKSELREVLTNLVFNALDAMPGGGRLTFSVAPDGDHVRLEVRDTGVGMNEEQRRRCMEPFFTTKGEHGTGLGLAMVYGIVTRHGGTFDIESRVGHGTACVLRFPVTVDGVGNSAEDSAFGELPALHLLVVDDEEINRDVVRGYLEPEGHTVVAAASGEEALDLFRAGRFDAVITDRAMRGMSGDQLGRALKRVEPELPVLLLTGFGDLISASGEQLEGVDRVIAKPVSRDVLFRALARLVRG